MRLVRSPSAPSRQKQSRYLLNIRSLEHLAQRLSCPLEILKNVAEYLALHYDATRLREKSDGGTVREIDAPRSLLKKVQRRINACLLGDLWLPDSIHAYRVGRSARTAVVPHEGRRFLWVADIRHFYPSISHSAVYKIFCELGCAPDVARLLTRLTTHKHRLPQGAPTSPGLANLYLRFSKITARLDGLARKHRLRVTFFGDDILISGERPFGGLQKHITRIITSSGLKLHPLKTLGMVGPRERHQALGIILNSSGEHLDVPRSYRRKLRTLLRACRRHGPDALAMYGVVTKDPRAYLRGKIAFAAYVNPKNGAFLEELKQIAW